MGELCDIVCPKCYAPLRVAATAKRIRCSQCNEAFPASAAVIPRPRRKWPWVVAVVTPVLMFGGCVGLMATSGEGVGLQVDAEIACEHAVTGRLRHPDVADFEHTSYKAAAENNGSAEVRGYVKTVNGFNAPTRVYYLCTIRGGRAVVDLSEA